jgi:hypothetical protein
VCMQRFGKAGLLPPCSTSKPSRRRSLSKASRVRGPPLRRRPDNEATPSGPTCSACMQPAGTSKHCPAPRAQGGLGSAPGAGPRPCSLNRIEAIPSEALPVPQAA